MMISAPIRRSMLTACLALPFLLGNRSCENGGNNPLDAGRATNGGNDDGDANAGGDSCDARACDGMPVPEIACASGPTIVVCERVATGACRPSVRCDPADAGSVRDAGPARDGGPARDAGSVDGGPKKTCGGFAGTSCPDKLFCDYAVSAGGSGCQGIADASGVCAPIPQVCSKEYAPVCGCDSHSYDSECAAHAKGVAVMHKELCSAQECIAIGGRPEYSDGASIPACKAGEQSFRIPGIEPAICCFK